MTTRTLVERDVDAIGFGAMNMSHGYGPALDDAACGNLLNRVLDLGHTHIDTAAVFGHGHNETMIGTHIAHRRGEYLLASKYGFFRNPETGESGVDSHPKSIRRACEESLQRLRTETVDLYYLHRWDGTTPVAEIAGTFGRLIEEGKIRAYGLSEIGADTLREAHAEQPCAAVQSEYSLWTRNPEIAMLDACKELGIAFVAFSPLARQFLTGTMGEAPAFAEGDIRNGMPRFEGEAWAKNRALLSEYARIAREADCTRAQLALAWLLARGEHVLPIPGTSNAAHMQENFAAGEVTLAPDLIERLDHLINRHTVTGGRYTPGMQSQVGTEDFGAEDEEAR